MKSVFSIVLTFSLLISASCSSKKVKNTNKLSYGMDQSKVEEIFGEPKSKRGDEEKTYYTYHLKDGVWGDKEQYIFVFDKDDKLVSYGKKGDFDKLEVETYRRIQKQEEDE